MPKLTIDQLKKMREGAKHQRTLRTGESRVRITVHLGTCGIASGARRVMNRLSALIQEKGLDDVIIATSGCAGLCSAEPMATVELLGEPPVKYGHLDEDKIQRIVEDHVIGSTVVNEYAMGMGSETSS